MKVLLNVTVKSLEEKLNRQIKIDENIKVSDLFEYVVASFNGKYKVAFMPWIYDRNTKSYVGYQFNDYMKEGRGFLVGTELSWKSFCVSFSYEWFSASKGKSTGRVIGYDSTLESFSTIPGTDSSIFQAAFTYRF